MSMREIARITRPGHRLTPITVAMPLILPPYVSQSEYHELSSQECTLPRVQKVHFILTELPPRLAKIELLRWH